MSRFTREPASGGCPRPSSPTRGCPLLGIRHRLTLLGSARDRASMHMAKEQELTDSMKMFRWGLEGGRPAGEIGIAPEWFHKGYGSVVHAHGEPLLFPPTQKTVAKKPRSQCIGDWSRWSALSSGHDPGQRVFRPSLREEELPQPGGIEVAHWFDWTRANCRSGFPERAWHGDHYA